MECRNVFATGCSFKTEVQSERKKKALAFFKSNSNCTKNC